MGILERNGQFYAQVKDRNGKWIKRSLNTRDRTVAKAKFREFERSEADPAYRASNETTFGSAVADFIASRTRKGCAEATLSFYDVKTRALRQAIGDETPLARVDAQTVDRYIDKRLQDGAARYTIGHELGALRGVLKVARRAGTFPRGVDEVMPTDWSNDYEPVERNLSPDEVASLLKELAADREKKDRWGVVRTKMGKERNAVNQAAMVAFMVAAGVRLGEARRAERAHIMLDKGLVFVCATKTRRKGVRDRYVPITRLTRPLLEQVLAVTAGRRQMFDAWANYGRDIADACVRAGISHCSPNDLRRTHGTWLRNAGVEPTLIGVALGHTDSRMVERVYGRLAPDMLLKLLVERLEPAGTQVGQATQKRDKKPDQRESPHPRKTR